MSELDEVKAHRDLLLRKLDTILEEFAKFRLDVANDKQEYERRANRFKVGLVIIMLFTVLSGYASVTSYATAAKVEQLVGCQIDASNSASRAASYRAKATQEWTLATRHYSDVRNDPGSSPTQIEAARQDYVDTLARLSAAQAENPTVEVSPCKFR